LFDEQNEVIFNLKDERDIFMPWYIINSNGKRKIRWDMFVILLVLWNCVLIPIEIAFPEHK